MTDKKEPKHEYRPPALVKMPVFLEGVVSFANPGKPSKLYNNYTVTLLLDKDDPQLEMIKQLTEQAIEAELERIPEHERDEMEPKKAPLKKDLDEKKQPTGKIRINLTAAATTRSGDDLPKPLVIDTKGKKIDRDYIRSGSVVKVQVSAQSYRLGRSVGLSLKLQGVKIIKEETLRMERKPFVDYLSDGETSKQEVDLGDFD